MGLFQEAGHPEPESSLGVGLVAPGSQSFRVRAPTSSRVRPAHARGSGPARSGSTAAVQPAAAAVMRARRAGLERAASTRPSTWASRSAARTPAASSGSSDEKAARRVAAVAALRTSTNRSILIGANLTVAIDHSPRLGSAAPEAQRGHAAMTHKHNPQGV